MFKRYYDIQTEGEKAHNGYTSIVHNPYDKESVEYAIWLLGWQQTEKRKEKEAKKWVSPKYKCPSCGNIAQGEELRNFYRTLQGTPSSQFIHGVECAKV